MPARSAIAETADLAIEYRPVAGLIPYARNARTHSDAQVAQIAGSIREFGFTNPILVDGENGIIAGHGRVLAARKLGMTEVPVIELADLSESAEARLRPRRQPLAEQAGWDHELLALELADLTDLGFDLADPASRRPRLDQLLRVPARPIRRDEETPEPPAVPVSPGRRPLAARPASPALRQLAPSAADVARLLAGVRPHLMVTDPPYGVSYDPAWRNAGGAVGDEAHRQGAERRPRRLARGLGAVPRRRRLRLARGAARRRRSPRAWRPAASPSAPRSSGPRSGWCSGRGDYHWQHEPCWYAVRDKGTGALDRRPQADARSGRSRSRDQDADHRPRHPEAGRVHAPADPEQLQPGQAVYEPFSGSGTTIIAAETLRPRSARHRARPGLRRCRGERWQAFTGEEAVLEGDGRSFAEIATERAP